MTYYNLSTELNQIPKDQEQKDQRSLKYLKGNGRLSKIIKLRFWDLINKFPLRKLFRLYSCQCSSCGRLYSEASLDYYIDKMISCKKCKFKTKLLSNPVSIILDLACGVLGMPKGDFKHILKENLSYKNQVLSYLEGMGILGFKIPIIPIGPVVTIWSITDRCNLNCVHCYVHKNSNSKEISFKEACKTIDQLSAAKNMILGFSGGDPLLREDIFDLIQYASTKLMNIAIATNGTLVSEEIAYKLKNSGVEYVLISIDGLEDVHDKIRGKGMFQLAIQGIINCVKAGLYVSINFVATKLNFNQIYDLIDLAIQLKVNKFEVIDFIPSEKANSVENLMLTPLEIEKLGMILTSIWYKLLSDNNKLSISWKNPIFPRIIAERYPNSQTLPLFKGCYPDEITRLFDFSKNLSRGILKGNNPFSPFQMGCEAGFYLLHIRPNGDISPCPLHPYSLGNIKRDNIQRIWLKSPVLNQYRKMKFEGLCNKCVYKIVCGGGCRSKVFIATGSHTKSDHTCLLNLNK